MLHFLPSIIGIFLNFLIAAYFVYSLVAIFKGAAPIPSRGSTVQAMMRLAAIRSGEVLYDLGSGDGRILFAGYRAGARCVGFEINPFLFWYTRLRIWLMRADRVAVKRNDFWGVHVGEANVITVYLVPFAMERLKKKVKSECRPGTRIVAAVYPFPDWEPVQREGKAYLYIV